jgi:PilZ domain
MASTELRRRATPRAQIAVAVTLARGRVGKDVTGRTQDLGPGGMRVATRRPLRVDEHLAFELTLDDGTCVTGRARVVREDVGNVYGLRFARIADDGLERLASLVA